MRRIYSLNGTVVFTREWHEHQKHIIAVSLNISRGHRGCASVTRSFACMGSEAFCVAPWAGAHAPLAAVRELHSLVVAAATAVVPSPSPLSAAFQDVRRQECYDEAFVIRDNEGLYEGSTAALERARLVQLRIPAVSAATLMKDTSLEVRRTRELDRFLQYVVVPYILVNGVVALSRKHRGGSGEGSSDAVNVMDCIGNMFASYMQEAAGRNTTTTTTIKPVPFPSTSRHALHQPLSLQSPAIRFLVLFVEDALNRGVQQRLLLPCERPLSFISEKGLRSSRGRHQRHGRARETTSTGQAEEDTTQLYALDSEALAQSCFPLLDLYCWYACQAEPLILQRVGPPPPPPVHPTTGVSDGGGSDSWHVKASNELAKILVLSMEARTPHSGDRKKNKMKSGAAGPASTMPARLPDWVSESRLACFAKSLTALPEKAYPAPASRLAGLMVACWSRTLHSDTVSASSSSPLTTPKAVLMLEAPARMDLGAAVHVFLSSTLTRRPCGLSQHQLASDTYVHWPLIQELVRSDRSLPWVLANIFTHDFVMPNAGGNVQLASLSTQRKQQLPLEYCSNENLHSCKSTHERMAEWLGAEQHVSSPPAPGSASSAPPAKTQQPLRVSLQEATVEALGVLCKAVLTNDAVSAKQTLKYVSCACSAAHFIRRQNLRAQHVQQQQQQQQQRAVQPLLLEASVLTLEKVVTQCFTWTRKQLAHMSESGAEDAAVQVLSLYTLLKFDVIVLSQADMRKTYTAAVASTVERRSRVSKAAESEVAEILSSNGTSINSCADADGTVRSSHSAFYATWRRHLATLPVSLSPRETYVLAVAEDWVRRSTPPSTAEMNAWFDTAVVPFICCCFFGVPRLSPLGGIPPVSSTLGCAQSVPLPTLEWYLQVERYSTALRETVMQHVRQRLSCPSPGLPGMCHEENRTCTALPFALTADGVNVVVACSNTSNKRTPVSSCEGEGTSVVDRSPSEPPLGETAADASVSRDNKEASKTATPVPSQKRSFPREMPVAPSYHELRLRAVQSGDKGRVFAFAQSTVKAVFTGVLGVLRHSPPSGRRLDKLKGSVRWSKWEKTLGPMEDFLLAYEDLFFTIVAPLPFAQGGCVPEQQQGTMGVDPCRPHAHKEARVSEASSWREGVASDLIPFSPCSLSPGTLISVFTGPVSPLLLYSRLLAPLFDSQEEFPLGLIAEALTWGRYFGVLFGDLPSVYAVAGRTVRQAMLQPASPLLSMDNSSSVRESFPMKDHTLLQYVLCLAAAAASEETGFDSDDSMWGRMTLSSALAALQVHSPSPSTLREMSSEFPLMMKYKSATLAGRTDAALGSGRSDGEQSLPDGHEETEEKEAWVEVLLTSSEATQRAVATVVETYVCPHLRSSVPFEVSALEVVTGWRQWPPGHHGRKALSRGQSGSSFVSGDAPPHGCLLGVLWMYTHGRFHDMRASAVHGNQQQRQGCDSIESQLLRVCVVPIVDNTRSLTTSQSSCSILVSPSQHYRSPQDMLLTINGLCEIPLAMRARQHDPVSQENTTTAIATPNSSCTTQQKDVLSLYHRATTTLGGDARLVPGEKPISLIELTAEVEALEEVVELNRRMLGLQTATANRREDEERSDSVEVCVAGGWGGSDVVVWRRSTDGI